MLIALVSFAVSTAPWWSPSYRRARKKTSTMTSNDKQDKPGGRLKPRASDGPQAAARAVPVTNLACQLFGGRATLGLIALPLARGCSAGAAGGWYARGGPCARQAAPKPSRARGVADGGVGRVVSCGNGHGCVTAERRKRYA